MATFKITSLTSRFTNTIATDAFGGASNPLDDTAFADKLVVDPGAYLIAIAPARDGAFLANTGAWTVTVNGVIVSDTRAGIELDAGNVGVSTISIGAVGEVSGATAGIALSSNATVKNAGLVLSDKDAISLFAGSAYTISNTGYISGGLHAIIAAAGISAKVTNSGGMSGDILFAELNDTLTNSGSIPFTEVRLGDGINKLTNSGNMDLSDIVGGKDADTVVNSKVMSDVDLGDGINKLTNSGTLGDVEGGSSFDTVINSGSINSVDLGSGNDVFTNFMVVGGVTKYGIVSDTIVLGDGDDKFSGGTKVESVEDGNGSDTISLGGGNDTYTASGGTGSDGTDIVKGGAGVDTYDATGATNELVINLDSIFHAEPGAAGFLGRSLAASTAQDFSGTGVGADTVTGFEAARGGDADDVIFGTAAINDLRGNDGKDDLFGFGGSDVLFGNAGDDNLVGGAGADEMIGGADSDTFWFLSTKDSVLTGVLRDTINDFEHATDKIDLSQIDADTTKGSPGGQAFFYLNGDSSLTPTAVFTGAAGELRSYWSATGQVIEGDVNGDTKADFWLLIQDLNHTITIDSADFVL